MNITYTWDFVSFRTHATLNNNANVVNAVACYLNAADDQGRTAQLYSAVPLGEPTDNFVPFESLNPEIVTTWVETALGETLNEFKAMLTKQLEEQITPEIVELSKPW
jgi:hypothetical protein